MSRYKLTTGTSTMLQKLSELFSTRRAPAGYRPGVTLEHLRRNLGLACFEQVESTAARASLEDGSLQLEIVECTESQLLMHMVMTEFVIQVPALQEGAASFEVHHSGTIRRTGLRCRQHAGDSALLVRLQARLKEDRELYQALMPLDFKRLRIDRVARQWRVRLEHMGGSEVVSRMPAFRRYIALSHEQRDGLFRVLIGLQRVLRSL